MSTPRRVAAESWLCVLAIAGYAVAVLVIAPEGETTVGRRLAWLAVSAILAGLAVVVGRWGSRTVQGLAMLAGGFTMVAVAGGVVAKRVVVTPSVAAILGVVAGTAGVVLTVRGWQLVLRAIHHGWIKVVAAAVGTLVVAQFGLLPAVMALDATQRPRATGSGRTPADLSLAFEDVRFTTEDGVRIAAWWIPSRNGAAVVVLPGAGSTREDALDHAAILAHAGFGALVLDLRGHGLSGGPRMEFGWGAEGDVVAAVDWLTARPEVTGGIGVLGLSMGGEVALTAAARDPRILAVVAEGASARTMADAAAIPSPHPVELANGWILFPLADLLSPATPPMPLRDAVARIDAPVLLITGNEPHEMKVGPVYRAANPDRVRLWALPDTPHISAIRVHPEEYRTRVLDALAVLLDA